MGLSGEVVERFLGNIGIQRRILLLVATFTVFGFAVMAQVATQEIKGTTEEDLRQRLVTARLAAEHMDSVLNHALQHLQDAADNVTLEGQTLQVGDGAAELPQNLSKVLGFHVTAAAILGDNGEILFSSPQLTPSRIAGLFKDYDPQLTIQKGRPSVSGLVFGDGPSNPLVVLSAPIRDKKGDIKAVLAALVDVRDTGFAGFVRSIRNGRTGYSQLVDAQGMVIAHSFVERAFKPSAHSSVIISLIKKQEASVASYEVTEGDGEKEREIIAFAPLSTARWGVSVEQSEDEALAPVNELSTKMTIMGGLALAFALLLFGLLTNRIIGPIKALTDVSRKIAAGDPDARAPVTGYGEVAELARSFNAMQEQLQSSRQEIEASNRDLEYRVQERTSRLLGLAQDLTQAHRDLQAAYFSSLEALARAIDARDAYTLSHSRQVAHYAVQIGREMGLPADVIESLRRAALLHDLGKIGIPDAILRKQGGLNDEEWDQIRQHPVLSCEVLAGLKFMGESLPAIRHHHERYDGRGYPDRLVGEDVPLGARILAVADAFHAMTSERPYQPVRSIEIAKQELVKHKGTQFDPLVVDAFIRVLERQTEVGLADGAEQVGVALPAG